MTKFILINLLPGYPVTESKTYYIAASLSVTWNTAHLLCRAYGLEMVGVLSVAEQAALISYIQPLYSKK